MGQLLENPGFSTFRLLPGVFKASSPYNYQLRGENKNRKANTRIWHPENESCLPSPAAGKKGEGANGKGEDRELRMKHNHLLPTQQETEPPVLEAKWVIMSQIPEHV